MFKNHILIAIRYFWRNKLQTVINVFGLSLAIASCLLVGMYLRYDLDFNKMHHNSDRLYRAVNYFHNDGINPDYGTYITAKMAPALKEAVPGIKTATRVRKDNRTIRLNNQLFEEKLVYAEPEFFTVFNFPALNGKKENFLSDRSEVIISQKFAKKHYPEISPLGESFEIQLSEGYREFVIAGVFENAPENSFVTPDMIIDYQIIYDSLTRTFQDSWSMSFSETYVLLQEYIDPKIIEKTATSLYESSGDYRDTNGDLTVAVQLQPFNTTYINLTSHERDYPSTTDSTGFWVLSLIGLMILLIASINFTTLSMGSSMLRAREVGIRKVIGSVRSQLIAQFWVEVAIIVFLALVVGIAFAEILLPAYSQLAEKELNLFYDIKTLLFLLVIWGGIVLGAGTYPAIVQSSFAPIAAIKGEVRVGRKKFLRRTLVFIQFAVSISLIAGTLMLRQQLVFIQNRELGYNCEQVLTIPIKNQDYRGNKIIGQLERELANETSVVSIAGSSAPMGDVWTNFTWQSEDGTATEGIRQTTVNPNFADVYDLQIVEGRFFDENISSDSAEAIVINETLRDWLGWDHAVGRSFPGSFTQHQVIGVVKDFHHASMYSSISPAVLTQNPWFMFSDNHGVTSDYWYTLQFVHIKIRPENILATLNRIKNTWHQIVPDYPFDFKFADDRINEKYNDDKRWSMIVTVAAVLAILISVMGLFGLASLEVTQRNREIGIRKVLGASVSAIVMMLSKEMTVLVALANLVAWPMVIFLVNSWLDGFAYKISINPILLMSAGLIAMLIAWLTVASLSFRAASANPVDSIRNE